MTRRDFKLGILEAHSRLEQIRMPATAANRVRQNIDRARGNRRRVRLALCGLALAGAASLVVSRTLQENPSVARLPEGFEAITRSSDLQLVVGPEGNSINVRMGACTLRVQGWGSVTLRAESWLRRLEDGVELLLGAADFQVDERSPGTGSTFVRGPQGAIEITGTRFSIIQRRDDGSVRLDEGGIRFHAPDGRTVGLVPGESLSWPLPAPVPSGIRAISPPTTVKASRVRRTALARGADGLETNGVDQMIDRITVLRAEGKYLELAEELGVAILRERRPLTRQRLSFELGSVLSYQLRGGARACAHWADHRRTFPAGHYAEEVANAEKSLRCGEEGETK